MDQLIQVKSSNPNQEQLNQVYYQKPITYQLVNEIKQERGCHAIAFNNDGTIMAAEYECQIKIWDLKDGTAKSTTKLLPGHAGDIQCLVFSKKQNWFASGCSDQTIRCWKEVKTNNWVSSQPGKQHSSEIYCLLLNRNEDELLSCSGDKSIKVWKVDCDNNNLTYLYSLDKHTSDVYCISLNESETFLVSCSMDKSIIIWAKEKQGIWGFNYYITKSVDDYGCRIIFINDNLIAWQQFSHGITHFFQLDNGVFTEKPDQQIALNQSDSDYQLFPSVYNKQRNILIQKHNKYVYIIQQQNNGLFKLESQPIDCFDDCNFGGITNDGKYLAIWNYGNEQLRIYKINYE